MRLIYSCFLYQRISFSRENFKLTRIYVVRYLRYLPAIALLVILFASNLPYWIADGPFNDIDGRIWNCRRWWWSSLLFIQNFANVDQIVRFRIEQWDWFTSLIPSAVSRPHLVPFSWLSTLPHDSVDCLCFIAIRPTICAVFCAPHRNISGFHFL